MSNRGHSGRCFRSARKTKARIEAKGGSYAICPIRWKVPAAIRPFLANAQRGQTRAQHDQMGLAIQAYAKHRQMTGKGAPVRAAGAARGA